MIIAKNRLHELPRDTIFNFAPVDPEKKSISIAFVRFQNATGIREKSEKWEVERIELSRG